MPHYIASSSSAPEVDVFLGPLVHALYYYNKDFTMDLKLVY